MASEIRVNKIENRSGLGTVTFADTGVDLAGIVTATTFSGSGASLTSLPAAQVTGTLPAISGANLTNLPAANLTGTLPAISGANLTGMASTDNVRTGILDVAGISTFRNTMNVGAAVTISESGIEASGIGITCANINGTQIGGRRNIIINGDCRVAQRGTSSTTGGLTTIDRWRGAVGSGLGSITFTGSQQSLSSSDTGPWGEGFRKYFRIAQSGAGTANAAGALENQYRIEAQDIANSGWNYLSPSSFMTISFWFRCSTNQTFYGYVYSYDGTAQAYAYSFTASANNTWTKITHTFPGNANLTFDDDANAGMQLLFIPFYGASYTNNKTLNTWAAHDGGNYVPDMASTWLTAGASTFDMTGLQLEVGSQATAFEHRSFGEEESLCQRYYAQTHSGDRAGYFGIPYTSSGNSYGLATFPVTMRATPTVVLIDGTGATGKATQHGINYFTATASGITKGGFTFVSRPSGDWNNDPQRPISAGYTADAEI